MYIDALYRLANLKFSVCHSDLHLYPKLVSLMSCMLNASKVLFLHRRVGIVGVSFQNIGAFSNSFASL